MLKLFSLLSIPFLLLASNKLNINKFEEGKNIYLNTCLSCHGKDGETNPQIMLVIKPRKLQKTILTQAQSFKIIKEGAHYWGANANIMPSFKGVYDDKQIESVAYYIHNAFNSTRDEKINKLINESKTEALSEAKSLKIGQKIFTRNCSLCHGIQGHGDGVFVKESKKNGNFLYPYNLSRTLLSKNQIFLYAKFGGHFWGTHKDDMPAWKSKYNDTELKSVAKYIKIKIIKLKE